LLRRSSEGRIRAHACNDSSLHQIYGNLFGDEEAWSGTLIWSRSRTPGGE
jgi:hypothetical protein